MCLDFLHAFSMKVRIKKLTYHDYILINRTRVPLGLWNRVTCVCVGIRMHADIYFKSALLSN